MRAISIALVTILSTVSAKFSLGACDYANLYQMSADDYLDLTDIAEDHGYLHQINGIDRGFADMIESLYKLGFKAEFDYQCDDIATIEPFKGIAKYQYDTAEKADDTQTMFDEVTFCYYDSDTFESIFSPSVDAFHRLVHVSDYWGSDEYIEYHYFCGDNTNLGSFLEFAGLHGASPSYTLTDLLTSLTGIFNKLGLAIRLHGIVMMGPSTEVDFDIWNFIDMLDYEYMPQYIQGYSIQEMDAVQRDQLDCPALP